MPAAPQPKRTKKSLKGATTLIAKRSSHERLTASTGRTGASGSFTKSTVSTPTHMDAAMPR